MAEQINTSRRWAVRLLAIPIWAGLAGALGLGLGALLRLAGSGQDPAPPSVYFTPAEVPPLGGVTVKQAVALCRDEAGIYALSLVCTHLGCRPVWQTGPKVFLCPCHGSAFSHQGARLKGPAARPLDSLLVKKDSKQGYEVASGQKVSPKARLKPGEKG